MDWLDETGLVALPGGARVRGRRLADPASPADFALVLAGGPAPAWPHRRVRWPDFGVPTDRDDALDALREAHRRANGGERVEVACRGGLGRTGTALAALAVLDGLTPDQAVAWVRDHYHRRAIETPWQRRWLRTVG
jgi:Protein-tyrosine phosphatase